MNKAVYKVSYLIAKLILFSCLCVNLLSSCGWGKSRKESLADSVYEVVPKFKYGICVDSFFVYHSIVGHDVNLSQILTKFGVTQQKINEFVEKSQSVFDVKKMKAGNVFAIFLDLDTARKVKYFVY